VELNYKSVHDKWIVTREGYPYEYHAHLKTEKACKMLIKFIHKNQMPKSKWLVGSIKRLLTDEEWVEFKRLNIRKQKYHNVNKGYHRRIV